MRSPMVTNATYLTPEQKSGYTPLRVLQSHAGWYVGTMYVEREPDGSVAFEEPGSRDSDYFPSEAAAKAFLAEIEADPDAASFALRDTP